MLIHLPLSRSLAGTPKF